MIAAMPMLAFGGDADSAAQASEPLVPAELLDAREQVTQANDLALEEAPLAVGSRCRATLAVPGMGETCRTTDGQLYVELDDGQTAAIHGLDAPPLSADGYAPASNLRVDGATPQDARCTDASEPHYLLVYARPSNAPSRLGTVAAAFRTETYKMSAYIDAESQAVDSSKGKRLPVLCDGGAPVVREVVVGALGSAGINFDTLVNQLRAAGLSYNDPASNQRYIVYMDAPSSSGAAGTGHVFSNDARNSADNSNNKGGLYAVQYRYAGGGELPRWDVLLHEVAHTMGAVAGTAPNASGGGHCNDGQDIMCYDDGMNTGRYAPGVCTVKVLDCNRDDYFNPSPAAGSYLARSWNMASTLNRWLEHRAAGDMSPPSIPSGIAQTGASNSTIALRWSPSFDDVGVVDYEVVLSIPGTAIQRSTVTPRPAATLGGLDENTTYVVTIVARDRAGNRSEPGTANAATNDTPDTVAPRPPAKASFKLRGATALISWTEAADDVGIDDYVVQRVVVNKAGRATRSLRSAGKPTRETSIVVPTKGMKPGVAYPFRIIARDPSGNASAPRVVNVRLKVDRVRPTAPLLRVASARGSAATLTWRRSYDANGISRYHVYMRSGRTWKPMRSVSANTTKLHVTGLRRGRAVVLRVGAFDPSGNVGWSRPVTVRGR